MAIAGLSGCRTSGEMQRPKKPKREKPPKEGREERAIEPKKEAKPIGTVVHVDATYGFVLVDVGMFTGFTPGSEIQARDGDKVTSVLKISPQSLRPFLTSDFVKGEPKSGNIVYK